ncbi:MAG TPA: hypothetical protein VGR08_08245, partial [Thermomicrobiales bacterium]|nr:hypothetical protein [Thermomicrobiales bacterium]
MSGFRNPRSIRVRRAHDMPGIVAGRSSHRRRARASVQRVRRMGRPTITEDQREMAIVLLANAMRKDA